MLILRVALLLPFLLATVAGAVPVQAAPAPAADQTLMNVATGRCLGAQYDPSSGATVAAMYLPYCDGLSGDAWRLVPIAGSGDYQIVADQQYGGPDCLLGDDQGSVGFVYAVPCAGAYVVPWQVTPDPAGGSSAPSQLAIAFAGGTKCLWAAGGTNIQLATCDGDPNEQWQRTQVTGFKTTSQLLDGANGLCLASPPGGTASPVEVIGCVPFIPTYLWSGYDVWRLVPADHFGDWRIINALSGWCLDSDYNGTIATRACNGGNFQTWQVTPGATNGSPPMRISDVATGLCLGAGGTWAYTHPCDGSGPQNWTQPSSPWDSYSFNLQNKNAPGKCVGTDAYSGLAGLWPCTTHPDQVWHREVSNPQGYAEIVDGYGRCLGVQSGSTAEGARIQAGPCTGSPDQYWADVFGPPYLQNYKTGLVMGVYGASTANGAAIVQWEMNSSNDQRWYLS